MSVSNDLEPKKKNFLKEFLVRKCEMLLTILAKKGYHPRDWIHKSDYDDSKIEKAECEICLDLLTTNAIYSCKECHNLICGSCAKTVLHCPFCRSGGCNFAERNCAVERFISTLMLPCRHRRFGCTRLLNRDTRTQHEKLCTYKPIICPYSRRCDFSGSISDVVIHLFKMHHSFIAQNDHYTCHISSVRSKINYSTDRKLSWSVIFKHFGTLFSCKITFYNQKLYFSFKLRDKNEELVGKRFGMHMAVWNPLRTVECSAPLSINYCKQKIDFHLDLFLSEAEYDCDKITTYILVVGEKDISNFLNGECLVDIY